MKEIKLFLNEMPYPPSQGLLQAAQNGLSDLNRYCDFKDLELLKDLLADYSRVPKKHIVLYPGTDLLLREIVHIFSNRKIIMVNPSFYPTVRCAEQFATKLVKIPLREPKFNLSINLLISELTEACLVIIDNPNNPTGKILLDTDMVKSILANKNTLLVIDEAYYEFTKLTFAEMVVKYPKLAVTRTISKAFGLAGARIGYLIAGEQFLDAFSNFFTFLPQPSLFAAIEAIKNPDYIRKNIERIVQERERVGKELEEMGLHVFPSCTNFLLVRTKESIITKKLEEKGIKILDLTNLWQPGFIRVSIGTPKENDAFLSNIREILQEQI